MIVVGNEKGSNAVRELKLGGSGEKYYFVE